MIANIALLIALIALIGCVVGTITLVIMALRKKSIKKWVRLTGWSVVALVVGFIVFGVTYEGDVQNGVGSIQHDEKYSLTITQEGKGSITPTVGSHSYSMGTPVDLKAVPGEGHEFIRWEGISDTSPTSQVRIQADLSVKAIFAPIPAAATPAPPVEPAKPLVHPKQEPSQTTPPEGVTTTPAPPAAAGTVKVHYIDVGQGDSILITTATHAVLIDAGEKNKGSAVVAYLKAQGVRTIDLIISTHPHADHIGGLVEVMNAFPVKQIIDSGVSHTTQTYINYLTVVDQKDIPFDVPSGQVIDLGGARLEILGPVRSYSDLNNSSVVAKLTHGSISFLFTGDMEADAESDLIAKRDVAATILKAGHHGSSTSSSAAFLAKVKPKVAVMSLGAGNTYGHPHQETIDRFKSLGVQAYRTDLSGTIVVSSDGSQYKVSTQETTVAPAPVVPAPVTPPPTPPVTPSPAPLVASASISNQTPKQNSTISAIITVTRDGKPIQGATVDILCFYKSTKTPYSGVTGTDGVSTISFSIGRASIGYEVRVEVTVKHEGQTVKTVTSFTPKN